MTFVVIWDKIDHVRKTPYCICNVFRAVASRKKYIQVLSYSIKVRQHVILLNMVGLFPKISAGTQVHILQYIRWNMHTNICVTLFFFILLMIFSQSVWCQAIINCSVVYNDRHGIFKIYLAKKGFECVFANTDIIALYINLSPPVQDGHHFTDDRFH